MKNSAKLMKFEIKRMRKSIKDLKEKFFMKKIFKKLTKNRELNREFKGIEKLFLMMMIFLL